MYGMWCMIVLYCVSILFLNISFCGPMPIYPQPDLYIIKINRYSNIQHMYVHTYVYILSLINFTYQFIINIHPYTTHIHTPPYIAIHPHRGNYLGGLFIVFLYYSNFFKKGLGNSRLLEYSISIGNN